MSQFSLSSTFSTVEPLLFGTLHLTSIIVTIGPLPVIFMSSHKMEENIPLSRAHEDSDSDFEPPFINRQRQLSSQLLVSPAVLKSSFFLVLSFILGAAISAVFTSQLAQHKIDADSDRQCAMHTQPLHLMDNSCKKQYIVVQDHSKSIWRGRLWVLSLYPSNKYADIDNYEIWLRSITQMIAKFYIYLLSRTYRASVIPEEEGDASGLTKHHVHRAKKYGGGYFANVEGLHHLHCLVIMYLTTGKIFLSSTSLHFLSFISIRVTNPPFIIIMLIHGVTTSALLRYRSTSAHVQCVLGQVWTRQSETMSPQAFTDFNTCHKCKDYEAVRRWAEENQVPSNEKLPGGYVALPEEGDVLPFIP
ncbi:tat pathway signal sequence protein [Rutstroemia sp. NJR-2017a WRK4]|nr:tat pathway signal sequence protein [Rutstroemia sp. NJR-2017a WRK4]PQE11822.1 tat pathway signal sequence protein [Rutstroemia sp. NJR-2017a WRK4]